ncbi:NADPH:quinone oxidoreductase [Pullulanibacillus camelliae]|uniref:NADPH:quinone oxidoreductase n=1 Tax=Pullulanibacillus camelliae TaxID=1707096 RepID=A0A8J2VUJ7_9BACL|nr:NAD(P)-dependent alcohol dehydrogenase [Pullulanibacillus camelliae]GGE40387.1 NADPH:quinone oxidoreductase [Pullulanibacillus camelliae]
MSEQLYSGTMRSYKLTQPGSIDHLTLQTEQVPTVQRGEVLVRVKASSLNYRDLAIAQNAYPGGIRDNVVQLSDGAGEIVAVGEDVRRFQVGDRVVGNWSLEWFGGERPNYIEPYGSHSHGWLTDYKVIHPELLVKIPSHLSFEEAATLPCAAVTAWNALHGPYALSPGDTVLTLGSGGVSVFAIQLAKLMGLRVISTTSSDEKAKKLKALGADEVINYKTTPHWGEAAKAWTGGLGVNRILEVGGADTFAQSLQAIAPGNEIALIGVLTRTGNKIDYFDLFGKAAIRTISVGSRADFEAMNRFIEYKGLKPVIDRVFAFEDAKKAYEHLESQAFLGKIVISHE